MSLNYDLKAIHNYEELLVDVVDAEMGGQRYALPDDDPSTVYRIVNYVTRDLIFCMMPLAIGEITEKNWPEVYHRLCLYEFYNGRIWMAVALGPDIVKRHIGLKTNVHTSQKAWNAILKKWQDEAIARCRKMGDSMSPWVFHHNVKKEKQDELET